jgi:hypothetical protein
LRCAGALDLDGYLWDVRKARALRYFLITDLEPSPSAAQLTSSDPLTYYTAHMDVSDGLVQHANTSSGGYLLEISGASHLNFTDIPLFSPEQRLKSAISPAMVAQIVNRYTLAFFETCVKGYPAPLFGPQARHPDGVRFTAWPHT